MLPITYEYDVPLPGEIVALLCARAANLDQWLHSNRPRPFWKRLASRLAAHATPEAIQASRELLEDMQSVDARRRANRIVLKSSAVGIVRYTDATEVWNTYYCQLDDRHILTVEGLCFDEDVVGNTWPNAETLVYWYTRRTGVKSIVGAVGRASTLIPVFCFQPGECCWPERPNSRLFAGDLQNLARDSKQLQSMPASDEAILEAREAMEVVP